jgi:hypothetical protein
VPSSSIILYRDVDAPLTRPRVHQLHRGFISSKGEKTMPFNALTSAFILALVGYGTMVVAANAQMSSNQAGFLNSGQTATLDCNQGKAEIMGSNNVLTITGKCSALELAGSGNKITIQLGTSSKIDFVGSGNSIAWTSADGKPPKISYVGSGNTLTPAIP